MIWIMMHSGWVLVPCNPFLARRLAFGRVLNHTGKGKGNGKGEVKGKELKVPAEPIGFDKNMKPVFWSKVPKVEDDKPSDTVAEAGREVAKAGRELRRALAVLANRRSFWADGADGGWTASQIAGG